MRSSLLQDLLYVIAYGPSQVKPPAVQMLFHYWPNLKPPGAISEYRGLQYTGKKRALWWACAHLSWATCALPYVKKTIHVRHGHESFLTLSLMRSRLAMCGSPGSWGGWGRKISQTWEFGDHAMQHSKIPSLDNQSWVWWCKHMVIPALGGGGRRIRS